MAATLRARGGITALIMLALLALAALVFLALQPGWQPTPPSPPAVKNAGIPLPAFDIVRVDAAGNTVIAGTAAPGAVVTIRRGGRLLGTATADASGAFAYLPDAPLPAGPQQLTLSETLPGGATLDGEGAAMLVVPAHPASPALTVLSGPGGSQVLSGQAPRPGTLAIGTVDYDAAGHAIFSGTAPPGAAVTLSLNGAKLGVATAGRDGSWRFTGAVPAGSGTLSLAMPGAAAVTAPFALETLPTALANGHVVIVPGQNLWLIARAAYGHGNLYTLIYDANAQTIHNPDLIFPGQGFAIPKQAAAQ